MHARGALSRVEGRGHPERSKEETDMNDTFHCEDRDALVAYLYDECDPADRAAIAAHVSHCPACAEEIASLRATRTQLAAWMPPAASLGFQITRADERNEPLAFASRAPETLSPDTPSRLRCLRNA